MTHRLWLADNTVPAGNQFSNTSSETAFASVATIPANIDSLSNAGRLFRIKGRGYLSSAGSSPGTLTFKVKWGATVLCFTSAIALPVSLANAGFSIEADVLIGKTGTSGLIASQGMVLIDNAGAPVSAGMVNTGTGTSAQAAVNTQSAAAISITATFSAASASNIATLSQLVIEEIS